MTFGKRSAFLFLLSGAAVASACSGADAPAGSGGGDAGSNDASVSGGDASTSDAAPTVDASASDASTNDASTSDASSDGTSDAVVGWQPSTLGSALSLWLKAEVGVMLSGADVTKWADQSGNGNDAIAMTGVAPTVGTTGAHPAIQFVAATAALRIADATSLQFPADFTVELVVHTTTGAAPLYSKVPSGTPNGMQINLFAGTPPVFINNPFFLQASMSGGTTSLVDGKLHIVGVRLSGATSEVRVDGVATSGSSQVLVNPAGGPVIVGRLWDLSSGGNVDYAEIVAVKGSVSDPQVASLEAYFKARYGL